MPSIVNDHLTDREISKLVRRQIKGKERVRLLQHLEICADCRHSVPLPSRAEIFKRLELTLPHPSDIDIKQRGH